MAKIICGYEITFVSKGKTDEISKSIHEILKDDYTKITKEKKFDLSLYNSKKEVFQETYPGTRLLGSNSITGGKYFIFSQEDSLGNPLKNTVCDVVFFAEKDNILDVYNKINNDIKSIIAKTNIIIKSTANNIYYFPTENEDLYAPDISIKSVIPTKISLHTEDVIKYAISIILACFAFFISKDYSVDGDKWVKNYLLFLSVLATFILPLIPELIGKIHFRKKIILVEWEIRDGLKKIKEQLRAKKLKRPSLD